MIIRHENFPELRVFGPLIIAKLCSRENMSFPTTVEPLFDIWNRPLLEFLRLHGFVAGGVVGAFQRHFDISREREERLHCRESAVLERLRDRVVDELEETMFEAGGTELVGDSGRGERDNWKSEVYRNH